MESAQTGRGERNGLRGRALSDGEGQVLGAMLHDLCGNMIILRNQVKTVHWNLRDQNFIAFHKLLDDVADELDHAIDEIAERARQLGMVIDVGADTLARNKALKKFPVGLLSLAQGCELLVKSYTAVIEFQRELIAQSEQREDPVSTHLLAEICRAAEKTRWLIESHLPR